MKRILRLVVVTALGCGAFPGLLSSANNAGFLDAVSFALTGSDKDIEVVDLQKCIFRVGGATYYLNNVQTDRIIFQKKIRYLFSGNQILVTIKLHGSKNVIEQFMPGTRYDPNSEFDRLMKQSRPDMVEDRARDKINASADSTLEITTDEYDRVVRAWSYIYGHGCTGKKSSF